MFDGHNEHMEALTVRVDKAVSAHEERLSAINRTLGWLPPKITPEVLTRIFKNRITAPRPFWTGILTNEHYKLLTESSFPYFTNTDPVPTQTFWTVKSINKERSGLDMPTTFVGEEIVEMLTSIHDDFEGEPLFDTDLLAPQGFIYLEKPLTVWIPPAHFMSDDPDAGEMLSIRAFGYQMSHEVAAPKEGHEIHPDDEGYGTLEYNKEHFDMAGGIQFYVYSDYGLLRYVAMKEGLDVGERSMLFDPAIPDSSLFLVDVSAWAFGAEWQTAPADEKYGYSGSKVMCSSDTALTRKFFVALMRFMWQELIVSEDGTREVPRPTRRKMAKTLGSDDPIQILKLRRTSTSGAATGNGLRLDHQVLVRGHMRNQYYPSLGEVGEPSAYRRIWIAPHVKGPEGTGFKNKSKATAVVR